LSRPIESATRPARPPDHLGGHVDTHDLTGLADSPCGEEAVESGAATRVEHLLTRLQLTEREWVGDTGERLDRSVGKGIHRVPVVPTPGGKIATGVEMELVIGVLGHLGVLVAHLGPQRVGVDGHLVGVCGHIEVGNI